MSEVVDSPSDRGVAPVPRSMECAPLFARISCQATGERTMTNSAYPFQFLLTIGSIRYPRSARSKSKSSMPHCTSSASVVRIDVQYIC